MSRFNKASKPTIITNKAGAPAYKGDAKLELLSLILSSFLTDKYYESGNQQLQRLEAMCQNIDPLFLAKAALYARIECGMRSVTHVMAAYVGQKAKGEEWTKRFFEKIIHRPDDLLEILTYTMVNFGAIPNAMKKGFAKSIEKMNKYELAKYKSEGKDCKMVDAINLVHPKSNKWIDMLVKGTLKNTETWESKLSASGGDAEKKAEAWADLLKTNKLGYMAAIKNIRNIIEQAPDQIDLLCEKLVDEEAIHKSLILPFRFVTAYENCNVAGRSGAQKIIAALDEGVEKSLANVPAFDGNTLVVLDVSSSMGGQPEKIGGLFAAVMAKKYKGDVMLFATRAAYVNYNARDSVMTLASQWTNARAQLNDGTSFPAIFATINKHYDRIIILSDMQGWQDHGYNSMGGKMLADYEKKYGKTKLYSWDLQGHGSLMFPQSNVACLAGWSDKAFDLLALVEKGTDMAAFIDKIEI